MLLIPHATKPEATKIIGESMYRSRQTNLRAAIPNLVHAQSLYSRADSMYTQKTNGPFASLRKDCHFDGKRLWSSDQPSPPPVALTGPVGPSTRIDNVTVCRWSRNGFR